MPKIVSYSLLIAIVFIGLGSLRCSSQDKDKRVPFGPEVKADLVIYFNTEVTDEQISTFWKETLSTQHPSGRGTYPRDGISEVITVFPPLQGHEAVAVRFFQDATQSQREEIKTVVKSSPLVYKVLENVAPADVKNLN